MPKLRLNPQGERLIPTPGRFLSIINSTGSFSIQSPSFGAVVGELGRQLELDNVREVMFVNSSDKPLDVEFEVANIKVHTSGKGGAVSIDNLPAIQSVAFEAGQSVGVTNFPTEFSVNNLPAVQTVNFAANQSLSVDNLPAVQAVTLEANQSLSIDNLPVTQEVAFAAGSSVEVTSLPAMTLAPAQTVSMKTASGYNPLPPADFSAGGVVIAANANRNTLVIMASENNTQRIWVGGVNVGIPLIAGQEFNLGSNAAVTLHAENPADTCYLAEVLN